AALDGADRGGQVAVGGHDDDGGVAGQLTQPGQGGEAVHPRQADVEQDGVGPLPGGEAEGVLGGGGDGDLVAFAAEGVLQGPADGLFVVDQEDVAHGVGSGGSSMRKQVRPSRPKVMVPPWASATWRATANPRPTPSGLLVTNGSNRRAATSGGGPGPESETSTM